jgi:uncharacterized protein (TIGR02679 family)
LELETIGNFMGKEYSIYTPIRITALELNKVIDNSIYAGVTLDEVVEEYFGEGITSKKKEWGIKSEVVMSFFNQFLTEFSDSVSGEWLKKVIIQKTVEWNYIYKQYLKDQKLLAGALKSAMRAGNQLPILEGSTKRMELFSAELTGDAHTFDERHAESTLLIRIIMFYLKIEAYPQSVENRNHIYYMVGLLRDDFSSNTIVYGISCVKRDGRIHEGVAGFIKEQDPYLLTLGLAEKIQSVQVAKACVFVVENANVFSELIKQKDSEKWGFICSDGATNIAFLVLMDLIFQQGYTIYYAGSFDPEGVLKMQKLKSRYQAVLKLWHYTLSDYQKAISDIPILSPQLNKLKGLEDANFNEIAEFMKDVKKAGSQEYLLDAYLADIKQLAQNG